MPPKYTRLSEDEKMIKEYLCGGLFSSEGIVCKGIPSLEDGNLFLTNKRLIFECLNGIILESTYHADVRKSTGSNMGFIRGGFLDAIKVDGAIVNYQLKKAGDLSNLLNNEFYSSKVITQGKIDKAKEREKALDYSSAIHIWEELGDTKEAARVRKLKAEQGSVKVDQTVIHGDYVDDRDTIIKDSVVSKSSIGAGGKSKGEQIKVIKELLDSGAIDDAEFRQMKKEILGK